jgi:hypothetical protein
MSEQNPSDNGEQPQEEEEEESGDEFDIEQQRAHQSIDNEERYVDQQVKQRILDNRREVDELERELEMRMANGELTERDAAQLWHSDVRRFLISIEPLLRAEDMANGEEFYKEVDLGTVTLSPPEAYQDDAAIDGARPQLAGRGYKLFEDGGAEPKETQITGLKELIDREAVSATWEVTVKDYTRPEQPIQTERLSKTVPVPRKILRNGVRVADIFLDRIGVGISRIDEVDEVGEPF